MTTDLKLPELPEPEGPWDDMIYTPEQMQERDRQIVELCARAAKQCRSGLGAEAAILSLLPKEDQHGQG